MKVSDLIELLEGMDPHADVFIMAQPNWPFEHGLSGVCQRSDFTEADECDDEEDEVVEVEGLDEAPRGRDRWGASESQLPGNDVFLIEGSQLRYGNKNAWDAT